MVHVTLRDESFQNLPHAATKKWGFQENSKHQWTVEMPKEEFEEFLKECNCIVYQNHIKNYQHGTIYGDFSVS